MNLKDTLSTEIQVSGLDFAHNMTLLPDSTTFQDLVKMNLAITSDFHKIYQAIPQVLIPGDFHKRSNLFDLDSIALRFHPKHVLAISGFHLLEDDSCESCIIPENLYNKIVEIREKQQRLLFQIIPYWGTLSFNFD